MGNTYLSQVLYNEEHKNKYLEEYESNKPKGTTIFYKYIFKRSFPFEERLKKDIYDFNDSELRSLIFSYKNGSVSAVQSVVSVIKKYLDYCVSNGYIRINLLQDLSGYEDYEQFVDKTVQKNKYVTREEFENIIDECLNFQDKVCIALPYYGFKGEKNIEITNLKVEHVNNLQNTIYIESRDTTYEVDDYLMNIITGAINEEDYTKSMISEATNISDSGKLYPNDYVVRVCYKQINEPVGFINVTSRLSRVKQYTGNPYLTTMSIWYSGMLDRARSIYAENGEVTKEDWIEIGELYGYSEIYWTKTKQRFKDLLEDKNDE